MKKTIFVLESFDGVEMARAGKMADLDTSKGMIRAIQVEEEPAEEPEQSVEAEPQYVYVYVTNDEFELPLVVEDTAVELAKKTKVKPKSIYQEISKSNSIGLKTRFKKVYIGGEE